MLLLFGVLFIFAFSLRIGCKKQTNKQTKTKQTKKTVEFVLKYKFRVPMKFIDQRVKQKIWFEYGLQIWFLSGFAIEW